MSCGRRRTSRMSCWNQCAAVECLIKIICYDLEIFSHIGHYVLHVQVLAPGIYHPKALAHQFYCNEIKPYTMIYTRFCVVSTHPRPLPLGVIFFIRVTVIP